MTIISDNVPTDALADLFERGLALMLLRQMGYDVAARSAEPALPARPV